jgi:hypothetical protein
MRKGKILKIRLDHNPNSSSIGAGLAILFFAAITIILNFIAGAVVSIILYNKHKKIQEQQKQNESEI